MARRSNDPKTKARGETFAQKLKDERKRKDISQSELSQLSEVPLDTLRSIENGRIASPGLFIAADLVYALDGNLDEWIHKPAKGTKKS